ncbi:GNAT family N-acetyltransferase [Sanguibacter antarcticus]|uniref:Ribosomal protein S18 acetylase RimI-like enzyme n=1 Tax=Sanguibacter antarcticus TaxID=372484 RepID=A0A2A9E537_9MICO|nr:N-acetyltransferase [Sanguibacter antarcticus]PFG33342.1 ribosomal protein S18 acetylase RimI-like enzyme [Sanguibacter antarcticus]
MITTRVASRADAPALAALAARTFPLACPPGTNPDDIAEFLATVLSADGFTVFLTDPTHTILVADERSAVGPVAYAMLVAGEIADPEVAVSVTAAAPLMLSKFYALPAQHGGGAAHTLMDAVVAHAVHHGADVLWLGVNEHNARARRFYEKSGFEVVGSKHFRLGSQVHDDFVMVRQVAPAG